MYVRQSGNLAQGCSQKEGISLKASTNWLGGSDGDSDSASRNSDHSRGSRSKYLNIT